MMRIKLNNEPKDVSDGLSIGQLIDQLELKRQFVAVELNQELIPRENHDGHRLSDGDEVEIVTFVGGG